MRRVVQTWPSTWGLPRANNGRPDALKGFRSYHVRPRRNTPEFNYREQRLTDNIRYSRKRVGVGEVKRVQHCGGG